MTTKQPANVVDIRRARRVTPLKRPGPQHIISRKQYQTIIYLIDTVTRHTWFEEGAKHTLCTTLRKMFGVRSIRDIPANGFTQAIGFLEQKQLEAQKHFYELCELDLAFIKTMLSREVSNG